MSEQRKPSKQEISLITALLRGKPETRPLIDSLDDLLVVNMNDGGMGSLLLVQKGTEAVARSFGKQVVLAEFLDSDGVLVSVAINLDSQGRLYELDMWKVNFAPLLRWPDASAVRIVS